MNRFAVIVLDSFGVGYMDDVYQVRKQDIGANTFKSILDKEATLFLPNLQKLGIMNALGMETKLMKFNPNATYGVSNLMHFGADTFSGHQEIMGTKPKKPIEEPFSYCIDAVYEALVQAGHKVTFRGGKLKFLVVDQCVTVADNLEADFGQVYNITATLDCISYDEVINIGKVVRSVVQVARVIAFGGKNVPFENILSAVEEKEGKYIGINAPKSGVYNDGYQVIHLGYGVDSKVQLPTILGNVGVPVILIGKVADIVANDGGKSILAVDTEEVMKITLEEFKRMERGFLCTNVQETDLAGHSQDPLKYSEKLIIADYYIGKLLSEMTGNDFIVIMADHGNDPCIGHSHHTREKVPLLIYSPDVDFKPGFIGVRTSLSDVGATAAKYFNVTGLANGIAW